MGQRFNFKRALVLSNSIWITNRRKISQQLLIFTGLSLLCTALVTLEIIDFSLARTSLLIASLSAIIKSCGELKPSYSSKLRMNVSYLTPASRDEKFFVPLTFKGLIAGVYFLLYIIVLSICWYAFQLASGDDVEFRFIVSFGDQGWFVNTLLGCSLLLLILNIVSVFTTRVAWALSALVVLMVALHIFLVTTFLDVQAHILYMDYMSSISPHIIITITLLITILDYFDFKKIELESV